MNGWSHQNKETPNADEGSMLFRRTPLHLILSLCIWWHTAQHIRRHKQCSLPSLLAQENVRSHKSILTAWTGAAMSIWTQTPGQSKPMWEAMKSPAQELGVLSRSCRNNKNIVGLARKENVSSILGYRKDSSANLVQSLTNGPKTQVSANQLCCKSFDLIPGPAQFFCPSSFLQCFWNLAHTWTLKHSRSSCSNPWGLCPQFPGFCIPSYCLSYTYSKEYLSLLFKMVSIQEFIINLRAMVKMQAAPRYLCSRLPV